jgi:hypothetical protein
MPKGLIEATLRPGYTFLVLSCGGLPEPFLDIRLQARDAEY